MKKQVAVGPKKDGPCVCETAPNHQTKCRLFSLPPELRNEIYMLVFAVPLNDSGRVALSHFSHHAQDKPSVLSILQTCRLIRNEAEDLFYNMHHLEIGHHNDYSGVKAAESFLKSSNAHRLAAIRTLTVLVGDIESVTKFFRRCQALTSLSSLSVLAGGWNQYPQYAYEIKPVKREAAILRHVAKNLPISLSYFRLRLLGNIHASNAPWRYSFERDIVTAETEAAEAAVISSIARRKEKISAQAEKADFGGVIPKRAST